VREHNVLIDEKRTKKKKAMIVRCSESLFDEFNDAHKRSRISRNKLLVCALEHFLEYIKENDISGSRSSKALRKGRKSL